MLLVDLYICLLKFLVDWEIARKRERMVDGALIL